MAISIGRSDYLNGMQNTYMDNAQKTAQKALGNISAQRALNGTDTANLMIADSLLASANAKTQGIANANDAVGIMQIADGTLANLNNDASKMAELSVRAINGVELDANGNIAASEAGKDYQAAIRSQMSALKDSMNESIKNATYNGQNVFGGMMNFETMGGEFSLNLGAPNVNNIDISNPSSIENFMQDVNKVRADIGSTQNGMLSSINSLNQSVVDTRASESNLQNNDIAQNVADLNKQNLLLDAATITKSHNLNYLKAQINTLLAN